MTQSNQFDSDIGGRVLVAFLEEDANWRTLGGIAEASGLTEDEVAKFIEYNKDCFVESSIRPGGSALYRIRRDLIQRAFGSAAAK